jgi:hypothetical protein
MSEPFSLGIVFADGSVVTDAENAVSVSGTFRFEAPVRRRILQVATVLLSVYAAAGCSVRMTVSSHVELGLDASAYRTFDWGQPDAFPIGDPRLDKNPFFKDHLEGAVEKGLARRGIELIRPGGAPDLLIHYHANISTRLDVNRTDSAYGYCLQGACPLDTTAYEAGTLVLDVVDARSNRLVWRGWAQNSVEAMLHNPDRMDATINEAVTRMLLRFPEKR